MSDEVVTQETCQQEDAKTDLCNRLTLDCIAKDKTIDLQSKRIQELGDVLSWYANPNNYKIQNKSIGLSPIDVDAGAEAREVLEGKE